MRTVRTEVLSALVVAFALIPESIAFSVITGVDPSVGLTTSFTMAVVISIAGGRPAMISAATGAISLVVAPIAREYGFGHLVAAVILGGLFQIVLGSLGVAKLMRFVPRSVMAGFLNGLGILIFLAQLPNLVNVPWQVYPLFAAGLVLIILFPAVTKAIPAPLVSIAVLTAFTIAAGISVPTVGDKGALPSALPTPGIPDVPFTVDTFALLAPYALAFAVVGLLESLMTARVVDDITDTHSNKKREAVGQGIANVVTGFFGGMGGCAMIGQTLINVKTGGARTRLSTFLAGAFLIVLCIVFRPIVSGIPMAVLVSVMVLVAVTTFDWNSIAPATLRHTPIGETAAMVLTVGVVVATHNLAIGVVAGTLISMVVFARRVAHKVDVTAATSEDNSQVVYAIKGELFFASSNDLMYQFDYPNDPGKVVIDLSEARIWDASSVAALRTIATKYATRGKQVEITGVPAG
ncbi:SulP family inorganic anion transporter [Actinocrispum sp. NPDC049592]|uniref:SulP family inorganic anion transporter n=1 Tax=Actinocrispum sp. NPDC049592 TaxID=3154835 RepID=UPI00342FD54F